MRHAQFMVNLRTGSCYAVLCESGAFLRAVWLTAAEQVRESALAYDFDGEGQDASGWRRGDVRNVTRAWLVRHLGKGGASA